MTAGGCSNVLGARPLPSPARPPKQLCNPKQPELGLSVVRRLGGGREGGCRCHRRLLRLEERRTPFDGARRPATRASKRASELPTPTPHPPNPMLSNCSVIGRPESTARPTIGRSLSNSGWWWWMWRLGCGDDARDAVPTRAVPPGNGRGGNGAESVVVGSHCWLPTGGSERSSSIYPSVSGRCRRRLLRRTSARGEIASS